MTTHTKKVIFIAWIRFHRRPFTLFTTTMNLKSYYLGYLTSRKYVKILGYFIKFFHSTIILLKEKPKTIIIQTGPIIALLPVYIYSTIFKSRIIIDAHNKTFKNINQKIINNLLSKANIIVVHNYAILKLVKNYITEKKLFVLPDKVINYENKINFCTEKVKFKVLVPMSTNHNNNSQLINNLLRPVAKRMENLDIEFLITGQQGGESTTNLKILNWLPSKDFLNLMHDSHCFLVLMNRPDKDVVQSARAIESLSLEKPIIHTSCSAIDQLIPGGVIFINNEQSELMNSILSLMKNYDQYKTDIIIAKSIYEKKWKIKYKEFLGVVYG